MQKEKQNKHWSDWFPIILVAMAIAINNSLGGGVVGGFILGGLAGGLGVLISYMIKKEKPTKKNEKESDKRSNYFELLFWPTKKDISDSVKNYDKIKWYHQVKYLSLIWAIISNVIGSFVMFSGAEAIYTAILTLGAFLALGVFIRKGYIFPFVLLILIKLGDILFHLSWGTTIGILAIISWFVWIGLCITCIRIEVARHKTKKVQNRFWKDFLYSFIIFIVGGIIAFGTMFIMESPTYEDNRIEFETEYTDIWYNKIKDGLESPEEHARAMELCKCLAKYMSNQIDWRSGTFKDFPEVTINDPEQMSAIQNQLEAEGIELCVQIINGGE